MESGEAAQRRRRAKDQKRIPLSMRITPQFHDQLLAEKERTGRSITQEAELLMQRGLEHTIALGGNRAAGVFYSLAAAAENIGRNGSWLDDWDRFRLVRSLWLKILDDLAPPQPDPVERLKSLAASVRNGLENFAHQSAEVQQSIVGLARALADDPKVPEEIRVELARRLAEVSKLEEYMQ